MSSEIRLCIEAAQCLSAALFAYSDESHVGIPHAFGGSLLPTLLGHTPQEFTIYCALAVPIRYLRNAIDDANDNQEDGVTQLRLVSANGFHCVFYYSPSEVVRIDCFPSGEYGPRTLSFESNPPSIVQVHGITVLSVSEYIRATLRRLSSADDEACVLFLLERFKDYVDPERVEDLETFVPYHPQVQPIWESIKERHNSG